MDDLRRSFFRACNPSKTIDMADAGERKYYIDFASVRGAETVRELGETISLTNPDPSCQLFTGHIGCGKSTELLRLKQELEQEGFHVVYFESDRELDMGDVDISDILLAIAHQIGKSLSGANISLPGRYFSNLLKECADFLQAPVELGLEAEIPLGLGKLKAQTKDSPKLRSQLRQYLEPQTEGLLRAINEELLLPAAKKLQDRGKEGLVTIVDNLDRVENRQIASGKTLPEYLFVERGGQLNRLQCHVVYTIPLVLMFSNEQEALKNRMGGGTGPSVLPMIPVQLKNGQACEPGLSLLRQMVLARAFPDASPAERLENIATVFDDPATLDKLCQISGGHARNLLGLLQKCLRKSKQLPIRAETLSIAIREDRSDLMGAITDDEWVLLRKVADTKKVTGEKEYQQLLRSRFVLEYRYGDEGRWFDINPLLAGTV